MGEVWRSDDVLVFFGSESVSFSDLERAYPDFTWARGKQVHGNTVLFASALITADRSSSGECDGVLATTTNVAASVVTADCLPILAWDSKLRISAAIHAGWRGVVSRIVTVAIKKFQDAGSELSDVCWWIGPHIQGPSFEVGSDVAEKLMSCTPQGKKALLYHPVPGKAKLDLSLLATLQIQECGPSGGIWTSAIDTRSDSRFASYRRSGQRAGRQVSFICRLR